MEPLVVILSTAPASHAPGIARELVGQGLAACVNITDIRSVYRWEGVICDEPEQLLLIKTRKSLREETMAALRKLHPYQIPEMIVLPVTGGWPPYLSWVAMETRDP